MTTAVLLTTHGTVDDLDDLPEFVKNIRRGHPAPPELIAELRRRYTVIGGRSPLLDITRRLASKLEFRLNVPVRMASRLWNPFIKDVLAELHVDRVVIVPLAQHSSHVYVEAAKSAATEMGNRHSVVGIGNWGQTPSLINAFVRRIENAASSLTADQRTESVLVLTAHSLPIAIVKAGDAYEREVRASAETIAARVSSLFPNFEIAFQSQGLGQGAWLGPDLPDTLEKIAKSGKKRVVFAPVGFLADHVEVLYDLDVEASKWANDRGLEATRVPSLNDDEDLVAVLESLVRPLL